MPAMVMHPIKPELDGKDLSSFADPNGKKIFVEFAKIGQAGGGQVDYLWPKPGSDKPQPKISYVRGFAPWGWVIGSGVYVDDIEAAIWGHAKTLIAICAGIVLLVMIANTLLGRSISLPIKSAIGVMKDIAEDRLDVTIKNTDRQNEIGLIARMAATFRDKGLRLREMEAEAEQMAAMAEAEKHRVMNKLADDFEGAVDSIVKSVSKAADEVRVSAERLNTVATSTTTRAHHVVEVSRGAAANVSTVAVATEELTSSIQEITRQVTSASQTAANAVEEADASSRTVSALSESTSKIGDIVNLISEIANQTNLLALNATIEAARAGEAGKGFAVVASEVKSLATQTAKATEDITVQIKAVQDAAKQSVEAINGIVRTIGSIDSISSMIAAAVEEQGAATSEIARNVQQASDGTNEVTNNVGAVAEAAGETGAVAGNALVLAKELMNEATQLDEALKGFIKKIRVA